MPITPGVLGTQDVTLPMTVGVGAGVARVSIQGANSTNPSEPGVNHFDLWPDASATSLAMQFKAGVKGEVAKNLHLFAEYTHLTINPTQLPRRNASSALADGSLGR